MNGMIVHFHTFLVLLHLLAFAVGLGATLVADWIVLTRLTLRPVAERAAEQVEQLSRPIAAGLGLLWLTGAALVASNAITDPATLDNQKLWAKVVIVCLLTLNAGLLHAHVLPHLRRRIGRRLFDPAQAGRTLACTLMGTVSAASWMCAAYLGAGRELNGVVHAWDVLGCYGAIVLALWAASLGLAFSSGSPASGSTRPGPSRQVAARLVAAAVEHCPVEPDRSTGKDARQNRPGAKTARLSARGLL